MAFAPVSAMTEDFMRNAEDEMAARRAQAVVAAGQATRSEEQDKDELAAAAAEL